jgi:hypothetical protein
MAVDQNPLQSFRCFAIVANTAGEGGPRSTMSQDCHRRCCVLVSMRPTRWFGCHRTARSAHLQGETQAAGVTDVGLCYATDGLIGKPRY